MALLVVMRERKETMNDGGLDGNENKVDGAAWPDYEGNPPHNAFGHRCGTKRSLR